MRFDAHLVTSLAIVFGITTAFIGNFALVAFLHRHKPRLQTREFQAKYGPFYDDYKRECWYFLTVKLASKAIGAAVVGFVRDSFAQVLVLFAVNLSYAVVFSRRKPMVSR